MLRIASLLFLLLPFNSLYGLTLCGADELAAGEVILRWYNGEAADDFEDYEIEKAEKMVGCSAWDDSKPTFIFIHGMHEGLESESVKLVTSAILKRKDWNVLALGYQYRATYAGNFVTGLTSIFSNSGLVGEAFGNFITRLVAAGVKPSDLYLVGYNIGAHVAGHALRTSGVDIPRLTALDPYIHAFYLFGNDDHLWSTDAKVVDVIHTNGVISSVATSTGTVDFFPNSGYAFQPGCSWGISSDSLACSSLSSYKYYAESVTDPTSFLAISCDSWTKFTQNSCNGVTDYMGYGYSQKNTGDFYLQTKDSSPYSKGNSGIKYDAFSDGALSSSAIETLASWIK